jgi:hypothetical protein
MRQGDVGICIHESSVVCRDVIQGRWRRSGDNSPVHRVLWIPLLVVARSVGVAVADRVVPPALRRAARKGRIRCSSELWPAVPPAEQDMREVGLPAVEDDAEPGGSACCPQRRVSRACCPQIRFLGPTGLHCFRATLGAAGRKPELSQRVDALGTGHVLRARRRLTRHAVTRIRAAANVSVRVVAALGR